MAKVLVTGGAGFIGRCLAEELLKRKYAVRIFDVDKSQHSDSVAGDVREFEQVDKAVEGCDLAVHLASLISVPESNEKPAEYKEVNTQGTKNVLEACNKHNVKRVVVASSAAVYGDCVEMPWVEEKIGKPLSVYAETKFQKERLCKSYFEECGLQCIALRFFNVFGPGQNTKSAYAAAIPIFISKILKNEKPIVYGDGMQTRDFIYVKNVVEAIISALNSENAAGEVFNIASGYTITINDLISLIGKILNKKVEVVYEKPRSGDIKLVSTDITKSLNVLGDYRKYSFEQGLRETIEWYRINT